MHNNGLLKQAGQPSTCLNLSTFERIVDKETFDTGLKIRKEVLGEEYVERR